MTPIKIICKQFCGRLPSVILVFFLALLMSSFAQALTTDNSTSIIEKLKASDLQGENDTLIVGSEQDYPPFATGMTDATAGGFTVDLWKAVAAEAGLKYTIRVLPFHALLQEFKAGKIDVLINLAISKERHNIADFTVPHAIIHGGIFVRNDESNIGSEADLTGKSIIVLNGDLAHDYAVSKGWEKQLVLVDTAAEGMQLLASGKSDAMLISKLAGTQTQQALALTKANGTYSKLYEKWFGIYESKDIGFRDLLKYLLPVILLFLAFAQYTIYRRNIERKTAQKALQESEHMLSIVLESVDACIYLKDTQGRYLYANQAVSNVFGVAPQEIVGQSDEKFFDADTVAKLRTNDRLVLDEGQTLRTKESNLRLQDGRAATYLVVKMPLRNALGEIYALCGISTDISDRKLFEDKLRANDERHRAILDTAMDGFWQADTQGRLLDVNVTYCQMSGYSEQELLSMNIADLESIESINDVSAHMQKIISQGEVRFESKHRRKDGSIFDVEVSVQYLALDGGRLVVFVRDITERKHADAIRSELLNRLQKIASRVPGVVYQYRLNADGSACFPFASEAIRDIYRVSPEEVREDATKVFNNLHPDDLASIVSSIQKSAQDLTPWHLEYRVKFDDGTVRWLFGNAVPERELDGAVIWHGFIHDITERKLAEENLAQLMTALEVQNNELRQAQTALVDSRGRYVDLYEFAPVGYLSLSKHGMVTEINWKATAIFGFPRKQLLQRRFAQFVADDDKARWQRQFSSMARLEGGEELSFDLKFVHENGAVFYAKLNCLRMDDDENQPMLRMTLELSPI